MAKRYFSSLKTAENRNCSLTIGCSLTPCPGQGFYQQLFQTDWKLERFSKAKFKKKLMLLHLLVKDSTIRLFWSVILTSRINAAKYISVVGNHFQGFDITYTAHHALFI